MCGWSPSCCARLDGARAVLSVVDVGLPSPAPLQLDLHEERASVRKSMPGRLDNPGVQRRVLDLHLYAVQRRPARSAMDVLRRCCGRAASGPATDAGARERDNPLPEAHP